MNVLAIPNRKNIGDIAAVKLTSSRGLRPIFNSLFINQIHVLYIATGETAILSSTSRSDKRLVVSRRSFLSIRGSVREQSATSSGATAGSPTTLGCHPESKSIALLT